MPIPNWNQWTDEQQGKFQILICEPLQSLSNWSLVIIKSGAKNIHSKTMLSNIDQGFVQFQVSRATWSLSYIWSLLPFSDIVCLNVFLVSIRSSCLFVCLSAGVYVACGSSWPVCMFVCFCPLDQVCLFVSIRSIWLDLSWGTTKQRCRGESCHHLIFRVQLGRLFCRRLNTGAFHQSTGNLFNGFPSSFMMVVKCFQLL